MKEKKRRFAIALSTIFFLLSSVVYGADDAIFIKGYDATEGELHVHVSVPASDQQPQFQATIDKKDVNIVSLSPEIGPITFYCMADISGSISAEMFQQELDAMKAIANNLQPGDNMVVGTLGDELYSSEYLSDQSSILEEIDSLAVSHEDTWLYAGIDAAIKDLQTNVAANTRKCLVILSDGHDDQLSSITREEASYTVKQSRIPVFTVAVMNSYDVANKELLDYTKILGSFARLSVGGKAYNPVVDQITATEAGNDIRAEIEKTQVLNIDTLDIKENNSNRSLRITCQDGGNILNDEITIEAGTLLYPEATEVPEPTATSEPTVTSEPELTDSPSEEKQDFEWKKYLPYMGGAVLVLLLLILFILKKNKSDSKTPIPTQSDDLNTVKIDASNVLDSMDSAPVYLVRFFAIGYESIKADMEIKENQRMTIGRSSNADFQLNSQDTKLSGIHCSMCIRNEKELDIRDENSTNGTFVNGIPLTEIHKTILPDRDKVRMGSYEYRIIIKKKD